MEEQVMNDELIEQFLQGHDPQKYIIAIEAPPYENEVSLIINDPENGKYIEKHKYKPFIWLKHKVALQLYGGNRSEIRKAMKRFGVSIKALKIEDKDGNVPDRIDRGFKYIATCNGSYSDLQKFFKLGGVDTYSGKGAERLFFNLTPAEQFLIQTGKRLFKGMDDYDDLHRLQFDLETAGLNPKVHRIFQIGIRDNRGLEMVIEVKSETHQKCINENREPTSDEERLIAQELRDCEREVIKEFFEVIDATKPDVIMGYNSENFDWDFFYTRCEVLYLDITKIAKTLNPSSKIFRKNSTVKYGQETEYYEQTYMWGYNIIDTMHAVRKAQAINSDIKKAGLKYITQFSKIAKDNRVYVQGDILFKTWSSPDSFYFNDENGDWFKHKPNDKDQVVKIESGKYKPVTGAYIVQRYLLDDLWETEQVDNVFNQATFLVSKILSTPFMRAATMGTAGTWKLIMSAWSYENNLAVPDFEPKREFVGGLARLLEVGYAKDVVKLDFAALYPKTQLTHGIAPDLDISGVMPYLLTYIVDSRDTFKFKKNDEGEIVDKLKNELKEKRDSLSVAEIKEYEDKITKHSRLKSDYDKKQLPLKILANSFFGSFGAPYLFPWGDIDSAEETTCRGRQYLRLMVKHFSEKYGFRPLVGDSVTGRSPIYIKYIDNGLVDIIPIQDAFNTNTDGERDFSKKPYLILTKNGWADIEYVYRHTTNKSIHRVTTRDRFVECTSDHSLFSNGIEVKPSDLKRDDKLDIYDFNLPTTIDVNLDEAWLLGFFIADGSSVYTNRKQKYFSKRKNCYVEHMGKRSEWTLNNTNYSKLEKAKVILDGMFNLDVPIKNYLKSSNVYKLKTHYRKVSEWFSINCYDNFRNKTIPIKILNGTLEVKKAFMDGLSTGDGWGDNLESLKNITQKSQNVMAGVNLILKDLDIDFTLKLRKDKENIVTFNLGENYKVNNNKSLKSTDKVWNNDIIRNTDNYVYDISADGTFICGVGAIICHNTDGFNFAIPDNVDDIKYECKSTHWKTKQYEAGTVLTGLDAVLAEFNEAYMIGRMGLDIDDICNSTINFARKNYANDINNKVKLVGNSIKSKTMPVYIEDFLDEGIRMLLDGRGHDFIEYYYEYVNKIYNYKIPLAKIATKKRVKQSIDEYVNVYCKTKTKAGNFKSRQAHMELILEHDLNVDLGDTIYYVNVGTVKSHGDIKTTKDKETGKQSVELRCKLIPKDQIENNPDLTTDEYNVPRYLEAFNKRISKLLVCFNPEIRDQIQIGVKKDKKSGEFILDERPHFTKKQCEMHSGSPFKPEDQDSYEDLMRMEDREIRFWSSTGMVPNNMEEEEWKEIEADWKERMIQARIDGIKHEKQKIDEIFKTLEVEDIEQLKTVGELPKSILAFADVDKHKKHGPSFYSIEWKVWLCKLEDIFKYEDEAIERSKFYEENPDMFKKLKRGQTKYDIWKEEMDSRESVFGPSSEHRFNPTCTEKLCCSEQWDGHCPCFETFGGDKDKLNAYLDKEAKDEAMLMAKIESKLAEHDMIIEDLTQEQLDKVKSEMEFENKVMEDRINNNLNDKGELDAVSVTTEILTEELEKAEEEEINPHHEITMEDVKNCEDCDEDEWNF